MATAAAQWEILDGQAALAGVDLMALSPLRLCNLVWSHLRTAASDDAEWVSTLNALVKPVPGSRRTDSLKEFRRRHLP